MMHRANPQHRSQADDGADHPLVYAHSLLGNAKDLQPLVKNLLDKVTSKQDKVAAALDRRVFGRTMYRALELDEEAVSLSMPRFVRSILDELLLRGLDAEGLFRISGNSETIQAIAAALDKGTEYSADFWAEQSIHDLSGLLKLYFRTLSEPIIVPSLTARALRIPRSSRPPAERRRLYEELIDDLPGLNRRILATVCHMLKVVEGNAAFNKMGRTNLGKIFGPTFLPLSLDTQSVSALMTLTDAQCDFVVDLLRDFDHLLRPHLVPHPTRPALASRYIGHGERVTCLASSPAGGMWSGDMDGVLCSWLTTEVRLTLRSVKAVRQVLPLGECLVVFATTKAVTIVDGRTGTILHELTTGASPIAVDEATSTVWITSSSAPSLLGYKVTYKGGREGVLALPARVAVAPAPVEVSVAAVVSGRVDVLTMCHDELWVGTSKGEIAQFDVSASPPVQVGSTARAHDGGILVICEGATTVLSAGVDSQVILHGKDKTVVRRFKEAALVRAAVHGGGDAYWFATNKATTLHSVSLAGTAVYTCESWCTAPINAMVFCFDYDREGYSLWLAADDRTVTSVYSDYFCNLQPPPELAPDLQSQSIEAIGVAARANSSAEQLTVYTVANPERTRTTTTTVGGFATLQSDEDLRRAEAIAAAAALAT